MLDLFRGAAYVARGVRLLRQAGVRRYAVMPLLINVVVFGLLTWLGAQWFGQWVTSWIPEWADIWIVQALIWLVFGLGTLLIWFYLFAVVANVIAAPFNAALARAVERHLGAAPSDAPQRGIALEAARSIAAELRKLLYLIGWMLPLGLLFLVPGINLLAPFLWFLFGAWLLSIEYLDYPGGNNGFSFPELRRRLRGRRSLALGFGGVLLLLTAIPVVNLVAIPVGVAGATSLWVERLRQS